MNKEEFYQLAKNRNKYKVIKQLDGELCKTGYLELVPRVFDFENELVGKNVHSVLSVCPECGSHGVNLPLDKQCGNCGYSECWTYYDAETIDKIYGKQD